MIILGCKAVDIQKVNRLFWFKQYLFRIKYMGIYTMSCETGSDIKHKAFVKVISCESK